MHSLEKKPHSSSSFRTESGYLCPTCNRPLKVRPKAKFCSNCGASINKCPQCGESMFINAKFCTHCGGKLSPAILAVADNQREGAHRSSPEHPLAKMPADKKERSAAPTSPKDVSPAVKPAAKPHAAPRQASVAPVAHIPPFPPASNCGEAPSRSIPQVDVAVYGRLGCPQCGQVVPSQANFCVSCGHRFPTASSSFSRLLNPSATGIKLCGRIIGSMECASPYQLLHWRDSIIPVTPYGSLQVLNKKGEVRFTQDTNLKIAQPPVFAAGLVIMASRTEVVFWDLSSRLMNRTSACGTRRDARLTLSGELCGALSTDGQTVLAAPVRYPNGNYGIDLFDLVERQGISARRNYGGALFLTAPPLVSCGPRCLLVGVPQQPMVYKSLLSDSSPQQINFCFSEWQPQYQIEGLQCFTTLEKDCTRCCFIPDADPAQPLYLSYNVVNLIGIVASSQNIYLIYTKSQSYRLTVIDRQELLCHNNRKDKADIQLGNTPPKMFIALSQGIILIDTQGIFYAIGETEGQFRVIGAIDIDRTRGDGHRLGPLNEMWCSVCPEAADDAIFLTDKDANIWCFEVP